MANLELRSSIKSAAKTRVKHIKFGDEITNICAGDNNPQRTGYFVHHDEHFVRCTDKEGNFWTVGIEVIYPGHLDYDKCCELFEPVWQAQFGKQ